MIGGEVSEIDFFSLILSTSWVYRAMRSVSSLIGSGGCQGGGSAGEAEGRTSLLVQVPFRTSLFSSLRRRRIFSTVFYQSAPHPPS